MSGFLKNSILLGFLLTQSDNPDLIIGVVRLFKFHVIIGMVGLRHST